MSESEQTPAAVRPDQPLAVVAAAMVDADGRILLARRPEHAHQGGLWEFPGGKLEAGETPAEGLRRELHEELGVTLQAHRPLIRVTHRYPERSVSLDVYRVDAWQGEPHGREGQPLAWVSPETLRDYPMPPADVPIIAALQLPPTYVITPPAPDEPAQFLEALEATLVAGARLLQLRVFDLPTEELLVLGRTFCALCHEHGARVLYNGDAATAIAIGADGLHLSSRALHVATAPRLAAGGLLAASCHSAADLQRAAEIGADFALLSPVLPTRSHPDADPLGWPRFAAIVEAANLPVYALGGMRPELLETAWQHGAQGIAAIRGLWQAGD